MIDLLTLDFLLLLVVLMPVLGIICVAFLDVQKNSTNIKQIVIWTTVFAFIFTTWLLFLVNNYSNFSLTSKSFSRSSSDHIAIYMIELTAFVFLMGTLIFRHENVLCVKRYSLSILALEALLFSLFHATNIIVFYFLLEAISIVIFVAIICASSQLSKYALKLLITSTCGSSFILFGIVYIVNVLDISEISILSNYVFTTKQDWMIFFAFFIGFLLKSALMTMISKVNHIISKAPTSLAIILACIFMQISNFGFIAILKPISKIYFTYFQQSIGIIALLTMALHVVLAAVQTEAKCIVTSLFVVQVCVVIIGIFSGNAGGMAGGFLGIMSVSVITATLLMLCHLADNFTKNNLLLQTKMLHFQHIRTVATIPILAIASMPFTPLFAEEIFVTCSICHANGYAFGLILCSLTAGSLFGALKMKKILFANVIDAKLSVEYLYESMALFVIAALIIIIGIFPCGTVRQIMTSILALVE
jgi:NADH-quinone oxidoreductase subunit M